MNYYEFIGVILGDGCILYDPRRSIYGLEISGNVDDQKEYFHLISNEILKLTNRKPRIRERKSAKGKYLLLRIDSKEFIKKLISEGISHKNKAFTATIPNHLLDWKISKHIIRGFFEADGSLFFSKSKSSTPHRTYPRIEMKTSSKTLAMQITSILERKGFKATQMTSKHDSTHRLLLSGEKMLQKWVEEIGFGDPKSQSKYDLWKLLGFHIPRTTHPERKALLSRLCAGGQAV